MTTLERISGSLPEQFETLAAEARREGFLFLDRLADDWSSGIRFDLPGECLLTAVRDRKLIAIGGLHRDPYQDAAGVGRLRRLFVSQTSRREHVGRDLVYALLAAGRGHFQTVRLRVPNEQAARFYEAIGFDALDETVAAASHGIALDKASPFAHPRARPPRSALARQV